MPHQINKKILIYIFLFFFLGTFNNKDLKKSGFFKLKNIKVIGLKDNENYQLNNKLEFFKFKNLYLLDKLEIENILNSSDLIKDYSIFKKYPSTIEININPATLLAKVHKNGKDFYLGSNGRLIDKKNNNKELPFVFGKFKNEDFFDLYKIINNTPFDYREIKNLFFFNSGRWDIETKSGIIIKLPRDRLKESFDLTLRILDKNDFDQIRIIDVRQKKQVIINE